MKVHGSPDTGHALRVEYRGVLHEVNAKALLLSGGGGVQLSVPH